MQLNRYQDLLIGTSYRATTRGLILTAGLVLVVYGGLMGTRPITGNVPTGTPFVIALWLSVLGIAATFAYLRDGLVICILLATAPASGWVLAQATAVESYPLYPEGVDLIGYGIANGLIFGLPLGILGFSLGAGATRLREHLH